MYMWTGPCRRCRGRLARLPRIPLREGTLRARLSLVPSREAKGDATRGLAVAAAARLCRLPDGKLSCFPSLLVRGVRRRVNSKLPFLKSSLRTVPINPLPLHTLPHPILRNLVHNGSANSRPRVFPYSLPTRCLKA